jgi:YesN/AraC family two-component response regulator
MAEDTLLSVSDDAIPNSQLLADEQHEDKSVTNDIQKGHQKMLLKLDTDELPTILVVDENSDMRKFLHTLFADNYYVIEAADGQSGLKLAREGVPDLIVSDIIMPVMNGLEFCKRIKEDPITSHIPVLLLSAQSTDHQLIEGFKNGAEAYITKPFNAQLLISHIESLLYNREKLRQQFAKSANVNLSTTPHHKDDAQKKEANEHKQEIPAVQMSTADRRFIDNLKTAILEKMADSHLKMEDLGDELGLSRVQLYRKVKALTGLTPVELLRKMRLQQAYALLLNSDKSVSEICYEVGFGTPSYFASCFKKEFDIYPADLKKNNN